MTTPPPPPSATGRLRHRADALSSPLPPLLVAAHQVAAMVAAGVHGRRRAGVGETFWQFRRYQAGDPITRIDWRRSARGPHAYLRETEWEAAQTVWLWRAGGPGMDWSSSQGLESKRARANLLTLALACLLTRGEERVALLDRADGRPGTGPAVLERLALKLDAALPLTGATLPPVLPLPRHARLMLAGDFLGPVAELASVLRAYAAAGVYGHLLWLLDPAEEELPYDGRVNFLPPAGGGSLTVPRVDTLRDAYRTRLAEHGRALADLAAGLGWTLTRHRTDQPAATALLALWRAIGDGKRNGSGRGPA